MPTTPKTDKILTDDILTADPKGKSKNMKVTVKKHTTLIVDEFNRSANIHDGPATITFTGNSLEMADFFKYGRNDHGDDFVQSELVRFLRT